MKMTWRELQQLKKDSRGNRIETKVTHGEFANLENDQESWRKQHRDVPLHLMLRRAKNDSKS